MDIGDGLCKVVATRVACKLPPRSALNLGFSTLRLRIDLGVDKEWWKRRISVSGESESGRSSSNSMESTGSTKQQQKQKQQQQAKEWWLLVLHPQQEKANAE
ncbi:hypothetical protein SO802_010980 [Lithocarpus litseifolius]|uniref:Uncharacterized protein n=1 Tax=Lithocarpus litseifolius TaxID=425828 RepID=A0AAW2DIC6_9ROSI